VFLGTSRLAVRKEIIDRIVPIPENFLFSADTYMFTVALAIAGAIVLDQPLCYYRLHSGNLFEFRSEDSAKIRRRNETLAFALSIFPQKLAALGVPQEIIAALLESD